MARSVDPVGGVAVALNGAILPDGQFATPWRIEYGALKDNGPHMFDLLTECLGPITTVSVSGDPTRWVSVTTVHDGGARASLAISLAVGVSTHVHRCEIYGPRGSAVTTEHFDHDPRGETATNIRRAIAEMIERGEPHRLDVRRRAVPPGMHRRRRTIDHDWRSAGDARRRRPKQRGSVRCPRRALRQRH